MRMRTNAIVLICALVVAALAISGCEQIIGNAVKGAVQKSTGVSVDEKSGQVTIQGKDGKTVTAGSAEGKVPDGFPADFPAYSGATVKSGAKVSGADGSMYTVVWTTSDPVSQVMSYYTDALKSAGFTIKNEAQGSGEGSTGGVVEAEKEGTKAVVTFSAKDGETQIAAILTMK